MFKRTNAQRHLAEEVEVVDPPTLEEVDEELPEVQTDQEPLEVDSDFEAVSDDEVLKPIAMPTEEIDAVRDLILELHPAIVPELVGGDSVTALIASITPAHEAYSHIIAKVQIPAGGNPQFEVNADALTTDEKIRRGLAAFQRKA